MDPRRSRRFQQFICNRPGWRRSPLDSERRRSRLPPFCFLHDQNPLSLSRTIIRGAHASSRVSFGAFPETSEERRARRTTQHARRVRSPGNLMKNDSPASAERLEQLREQAWEKGVVTDRGVNVAGGPVSRQSGYL